jgi:AcrR family transcriptional regulator
MPKATTVPETAAATTQRRVRKPDAAATRENILSAARKEFAEHGLSGARVDAIAALTHTTKRMIYYYFGSKEGLYLAVLEQAYGDIRAVEQTLDLQNLSPVEAIRRLVEFTFEYQDAHPDFVRLVTIENIHHARYLATSEKIRSLNVPVIASLAAILARGRAEGMFRTAVDPVDMHMIISALCFFRVSNRYTFGTLFGCDLSDPALRARHKRLAADAVVRLLQGDPAGGALPAAEVSRARSGAPRQG